ncbi:MAG: hypothetical protein C0404_04395, partial [Verrucomicrobia bacterium]|nr:hypothetical protein [Verrucomicrobiota bacterium]
MKYPFIRVEETVTTDSATGREKVTINSEMVADHVMVKVRPDVDQAALKAVAERHGMQVLKKMHMPGMFLVKAPKCDLNAVKQTMAALSGEQAVVKYAEPDSIAHVLNDPDDPDFGKLWGLKNEGQVTPRYTEAGIVDADIDAPEAWQVTQGSRDVLVAVIDTGIDYGHPDLEPNMWANPGETGLDAQGRDKRANGVDDDGNGFADDWHGWDFCNDDNDPIDDHFHGTHCAGTIGGVGNNGLGV